MDGALTTQPMRASRPAGAQHVGVVNAVSSGQSRSHQRHHLVAGVGSAWGATQVSRAESLSVAPAQGIRGFPAKATTAFAKVYVNGTSRCGSSISSCPRRATYALLRWSRWRAPLMFKRQSSIWRLTPYVVCANSWPMPELTIRHAAWLGTSR